jgi:hypothetical protein
MPRNNLMFDLETLGKRTDAAITQISAAWFDPETGEIGGTFDGLIRNSGGTVDIDTVAWWLQQAHAPVLGAKLSDPSQAGDEAAVLAEFCAFVRVHGEPARVWAHGGTGFDFPILRSALDRHDLATPWGYRAPRDTRSLYDLAPGGCPSVPVDETRKHDAAYDCEVQVAQVCGALRALRDAVACKGMVDRLDVSIMRASAPPPRPVLDIPVWSAAEGRCEAYANDRSPDSVCE